MSNLFRELSGYEAKWLRDNYDPEYHESLERDLSLSRSELAQILGAGPSTLYNWGNMVHSPNIVKASNLVLLKRIVEALKCQRKDPLEFLSHKRIKGDLLSLLRRMKQRKFVPLVNKGVNRKTFKIDRYRGAEVLLETLECVENLCRGCTSKNQVECPLWVRVETLWFLKK